MAIKHPYQGMMHDERRKEMKDCREPRDLDELMRDRDSGINAEPDEGPRDGVTHAKRMHPNHYIPNGGDY